MFFKKKVYPILPTSESDTMTFIQKLDYLEYKVNELNEKFIAAESGESVYELNASEQVSEYLDLTDVKVVDVLVG